VLENVLGFKNLDIHLIKQKMLMRLEALGIFFKTNRGVLKFCCRFFSLKIVILMVLIPFERSGKYYCWIPIKTSHCLNCDPSDKHFYVCVPVDHLPRVISQAA